MSELTATAHAKLNLTLEVLGPRPDGFHELATIVQTVALGDRITIAPATADRLTVTGPRAVGTPSGPGNLALRALHELRCLGVEVPPLAIAIEKHVPPAGGLGGGAADAAALLRLCARLTPVDESVLLEAAARTGSDEPALLLGGTVLARGRGETVSPLPDLPPHDVVLFLPDETLDGKTARLFAALDSVATWDDGEATRHLTEALSRAPALAPTGLQNAFERVAFDQFRGLAELHERLTHAIGVAPRLAGAGPVLFWLGPPGGGAVVARLADGIAPTVIPTRTVPSPWRA